MKFVDTCKCGDYKLASPPNLWTQVLQSDIWNGWISNPQTRSVRVAGNTEVCPLGDEAQLMPNRQCTY